MDRFGFFVRQYDKDKDDWYVALPHQCDSWAITDDTWGGVPHAEAVAQLRAFITEAEDAFTALVESGCQ